MSEPKTVPMKTVLKIIQHHAAGEHEKVQEVAVQLAADLDAAGDVELGLYILAQYRLIPTFEVQ